MTFIQPFMLWGLLLASLPVLIHLINKMRHRPQPWAALQFLLKASRSSVRQQRLKQFLILLCRTLAVAALVLFLSRPLIGGWFGWMVMSAPEAIVILLDRSASMEFAAEGQNLSAREQALALIGRSAKPFEGASHFILIDSALRIPQEISKPENLSSLPTTAATDTTADIPGLFQSALSWLAENKSGSAEIWLVSDLQKSNWAPDDSRWKAIVSEFAALPQKVRIRLLSFDSTIALDTSVALHDVIRKRRGAESEVEFVLDFQRSKISPDPILLAVTLNGNPSQAEVRMEGTSFRWRHKVTLGDKTNGGWGSFTLPNDGNVRNNSAYFVYPPELGAQALVVANPGSGAARALRLAASAISSGVRRPARLLGPSAFAAETLTSDTLILWQSPPPNETDSEKLRQFIEQGGVVVFFPPGTADPARFLGFGWGEVQSAAEGQNFRVVRWDESEGPLGKTDEGLSLPLAQSSFHKRQQIFGAGTPLASFDDRAPLLIRATIGRGQVLFCASTPDPDWSSLGEGPVLVPLAQRLLLEGARRLYPQVTAVCGEIDPVDAKLAWTPVEGGDSKDLRIAAGVYRNEGRFLAVNRPPAEDFPERIESGQLTALFGDLPFQMFNEQNRRTDDLQSEFWRVFVFGMLLLLLAEALLILPPRVRANPLDPAAAAALHLTAQKSS